MNRNIFKFLACSICVASAFLYWQDNHIVITEYKYENEKVPKNFEGFRIVQVSDLQNKKFYKNQSSLIKKVKKANPDIIVITGDIIDANRTNLENAFMFIDKAKSIAPIYYASGNHENHSDKYDEIIEGLSLRGVHILENKYEHIERNGEKIAILGLRDIRTSLDFQNALYDMVNENYDYLKILLSHRPELYYMYDDSGVDLSFTGHAHGGQIRLPFTDGLFAPNQGFLPKYTSGIRHFENSSMVISRGLGNSIFPFRIFNRPEITVTTLYSK